MISLFINVLHKLLPYFQVTVLMKKLLPKKSFSAYELAALKLPGFPGTAKGWYQFVVRENWKEVEVVGSGRGRKGGVWREFIPPDGVLALVHEAHSATNLSPNTYIYSSEPVKPLVSGAGAHSGLTANDHPSDAISIDRYVDVSGSAGPGQWVGDEAVVQVRVDARLLRERVGNNFCRIKIANVSGDSMEPTLSHGDQVLVDTSVDRFVENAIYAIQQDGFLRFKRIKLLLDGSIIVSSDNVKDNEPEKYTPDVAQYFKVIGVVIPFKFGRFKL